MSNASLVIFKAKCKPSPTETCRIFEQQKETIFTNEADSKIFCRLMESYFFLPDIRTDFVSRANDNDFWGGWRKNEDLIMRLRARAMQNDTNQKKLKAEQQTKRAPQSYFVWKQRYDSDRMRREEFERMRVLSALGRIPEYYVTEETESSSYNPNYTSGTRAGAYFKAPCGPGDKYRAWTDSAEDLKIQGLLPSTSSHASNSNEADVEQEQDEGEMDEKQAALASYFNGIEHSDELSLLYQPFFVERLGSHKQRQRKTGAPRDLTNLFAAGVRLDVPRGSGPSSAGKPEETMNVGSKTPQPDPRPRFLSKAADKTLRLTKSTTGAIPIHLFHGNHCNGSANGADTRRKPVARCSPPPPPPPPPSPPPSTAATATTDGWPWDGTDGSNEEPSLSSRRNQITAGSMKLVVHLPRTIKAPDGRIRRTVGRCFRPRLAASSSGEFSSVMGRKLPPPVITKHLKDSLEKTVEVKLLTAQELPMSTVTVIWQAPQRVTGVTIGQIMSKFGPVETVHMSRRNTRSAQVVFGDIVDACHAVKNHKIAVSHNPCLYIDWYHEYMRSRPYSPPTSHSDDSLYVETAISTPQPTCPTPNISRSSSPQTTSLSPIRANPSPGLTNWSPAPVDLSLARSNPRTPTQSITPTSSSKP